LRLKLHTFFRATIIAIAILLQPEFLTAGKSSDLEQEIILKCNYTHKIGSELSRASVASAFVMLTVFVCNEHIILHFL
jgi:hypothetical protein